MGIDIKKIEISPMFQLSLGSKELFHSNFLFWLSKAEPNAFWGMMNLFGINTDDNDSLIVKREWNHFDLSIVRKISKSKRGYDDIVAVIENKVKSIPNEIQIEKYNGSIAKTDGKPGCTKILLSLIEPNFDNVGWNLVSYEKYLQYLLLCKNEIHSSYNAAIYEDYSNLVETLIEFKKRWIGNEKTLLKTRYTDILNSEETLVATSLRINDLRHKLIYSTMLEVVARKLKEQSISYVLGKTDDDFFQGADNVLIGAGMTRAMGLIELKVKISDDLIVGVQVQNNQYRHFVIFKDNASRKTDEIKKLLRKFFGEENSFEHQGRKSMELGSFTNRFKYVYKVIIDQTIENIIDNVLSDASQLIARIGKTKM